MKTKNVAIKNFPIKIWFLAMSKAKLQGTTMAQYLSELVEKDGKD